MKALQEEKAWHTRISERRDAVERELNTLQRRLVSLEQEIASLAGCAEEFEQLRRHSEGYTQAMEQYERDKSIQRKWDRLTQELSFLERRQVDLERRIRLQGRKEEEFQQNPG
jgi:hypothetical protein